MIFFSHISHLKRNTLSQIMKWSMSATAFHKRNILLIRLRHMYCDYGNDRLNPRTYFPLLPHYFFYNERSLRSLCNVTVNYRLNPISWIRSYLSPLLSISSSFPWSFLAMSSYFLSLSARVNLSSFSWHSSLSHCSSFEEFRFSGWRRERFQCFVISVVDDSS